MELKTDKSKFIICKEVEGFQTELLIMWNSQ